MAGYVQRLVNRLAGIQTPDAMAPRITRRQVGNEWSMDAFGSVYEATPTQAMPTQAIPTQAVPRAEPPAPLLRPTDRLISRAVTPPKDQSDPARFLQSEPDPAAHATKVDTPRAGTTRPAGVVPDAAAANHVDSITAFRQPGSKREVSSPRSEPASTRPPSRPLAGQPVHAGTLVPGTPRGEVSPSGPPQAGATHMRTERVPSPALRQPQSQPTKPRRPRQEIKPDDTSTGHDGRGEPGPATPSAATLPEQRRPLSVPPAELAESSHSAPVRPKGITQVHIGNVHVHVAEEGTTPPAPSLQEPRPKRTAPIHRTAAAEPSARHYGLGQM